MFFFVNSSDLVESYRLCVYDHLSIYMRGSWPTERSIYPIDKNQSTFTFYLLPQSLPTPLLFGSLSMIFASILGGFVDPKANCCASPRWVFLGAVHGFLGEERVSNQPRRLLVGYCARALVWLSD